MSKDEKLRSTRRSFMKHVGVTAAGLPLAPVWSPSVREISPSPPALARRLITLRVNGTDRSLELDTDRALVEGIREDLGLTGTKVACNRASCGACAVLMNGRTAFACHTLAVQAHGKSIETIEGLEQGGKLHPF